MKFVHTLLAIILICLTANAATYYVKTNGNDSLDGTSLANAWLTLQHSADTAGNGDMVLVEPGTYDEQVTVTRSGITFRADGSGVILPGMFNLTSADEFHLTRNSSSTTIDGFEMRGTSANSQLGCVYIGLAVTNTIIQNNLMHDTQVWSSQGAVGPVTFDSDNTGSNSCSGTIITNNRIYNFGGVAVAIKGFNGIITGNWISNSYGCDCFNIQGANHVISNNFCTQIGLGIVNLWGASNASFNGTYWYSPSATASNTFGTWYGPGGHVLVYSPDTYVARGWSNAAVVMDATLTHPYTSASRMYNPWTMHDSIMGTTFTNGIGAVEHADWVESLGPLVNPLSPLTGLSASNIMLVNNFIVNCPGGSACMFGGNTTNFPGPCLDWTFKNNVWLWTDVTGGITDVRSKFYNNTFYQCATSGNSGVISFTFYPTNSPDPRGWSFYSECKSNVFVGCGPGSSQGWYGVAAAGSAADWGVADISWPHYPTDTVLTNCDYNYVGEINGAPKDSDSPIYPASSPFKFSEPHGTNGGNIFINLPLGIWGFTNSNGTVFGANITNRYSTDTSLLLQFSFSNINSNKVVDDSGNNHDGWNMMGTNWIYATSGLFSGSAGFWTSNGVATGAIPYPISTYLAITNVSGLTNITKMSLSLWTKTDTIGAASGSMFALSGGFPVLGLPPDNQTVCSNSWDFGRFSAEGNAPSGSWRFILNRSDNSVDLLSFPCDIQSCPLVTDGTQNSWHHYVVTVDCVSNSVIGYYDGVAVTNNTVGAPYITVYGGPNQRWLCVGAQGHNGSPQWGDPLSPNDGFYAGRMQELRIYNRVLNPIEVLGLFKANSTDSIIPPSIVTQPQSTGCALGSNATFTVIASGASPLSYQWMFNGNNIAAATSSSFTKVNVQNSDVGNYQVIVTNVAGSITSSIATLVIQTELVLRFTFDDTTNTNFVYDVTGNNHNGYNMMGTNWITFVSGPTNIGPFTNAGLWTSNGTVSGSPLSTYLAITNVNRLTNMPAMTLAVWVETATMGQDGYLAILGSGKTVSTALNPTLASNSWDFGRFNYSGNSPGATFNFTVHALDGDHSAITFPCDTTACSPVGPLVQTNWKHYAISFDSSNGIFIGYTNGVPYQTNTLSIPYLTIYGKPGNPWLCVGANTEQSDPTWSGNSPSSKYFCGKMDDLRIYNRAMSPSEIVNIYYGTNSLPPPISPTNLHFIINTLRVGTIKY